MENQLKRFKDRGSCRALRGSVAVCAVFVQEPGNVWTEAEIREQQTAQTEALQYLLRQARVYGVPLRFRQTVRRMDTQRVWAYGDTQNFVAAYIKSEGKRSFRECIAALSAAAGTEQAAFVFLFKKEAVSFASCAYSGDEPEAVFMYGKLHFSVLHELLHLFGAVDLYYPQPVAKEVSRLFPNSAMFGDASPDRRALDDLTLYLIGWTDRISAGAQALLNAGAGYTHEDMNRSMREIVHSDYVEKYYPNGVYYGPVRNGSPNGKGRMVYSNGNIYEGEFLNGAPHGVGTAYLADGTVLQGSFVKGVFKG